MQQNENVVLQFIKELPKEFFIEKTKKLKVSSQDENIQVERQFRSTKSLSLSQVLIYNQLNELLKNTDNENTLNEIQGLMKTLSPQYQVGELMLNILDIEKITFLDDDQTNEEKSDFQVEKGLVYLVVIWGSWYSDSREILTQSQQFFETNNSWAGKVKIIGISNDSGGEITQWKQIEHYRFSENSNNDNTPVKYYFKNRTFPYIILINKWGRIDYLGKQLQDNIETRINELIVAENDEIKKQDQQQDFLPEDAHLEKEYKELKLQMIKLQEAVKEAKFQGKFEAVLEIVSYFNSDGLKFIHKMFKLELSYDIRIEEEPKLNQIFENYWNQIPENLKFVKKSIIRDPLRDIKLIKKSFQEVYKALGVEIQYVEIEKTNLIHNQRTNETMINKKEDILVLVKNINIDLYNKGQENMGELLQKYCDEGCSEIQLAIESTKKQIQNALISVVGKQFEEIQNYKKWGEEEYINIQHQQGQVLFLIYWVCWNDEQNGRPNIIKEFLESTSGKWGEDVKFVSLGLVSEDEAKEYLQNYQDCLTYMEFYFPKQSFEFNMDLYQLSSPHFVLNVANYVELVEQLIKQKDPMALNENDELIAENFINGKIPMIEIAQDTVQKTLGFIQDSQTQEIITGKINFIEFEITFEKVTIECQDKYKRPKLKICCRDFEFEGVNQIVSQIYSIIPENQWDININLQKTQTIPYPGNACVLCQKNIINEPQQYYCPFKQEHVCVECAEFDDKTKTGNDRFKYLDTLIFINGPLTDLSVLKIDDHKIGKNLQLKEGEEGSQFHQIVCNGCLGTHEGPRYIAANARQYEPRNKGYIDFCQECFQILKEKKSDKAQAIIWKNQNEGMSEDNLLVRILFNHGDYFEF